MNKIYKILVIFSLLLLLSGCIDNKQVEYINKEYQVISVNEYYMNRNIVYSVVYVDSGEIKILQSDIKNALHVKLSNRTYLLLDTKVTFGYNEEFILNHWNVYISNQSIISPKNSEWRECSGEFCTIVYSSGSKLS